MKHTDFKPRICPNCGRTLGLMSYSPTKSKFFPDGRLTICNDCLDSELAAFGGEWALMDSICAWADIPWIPEQFTKIYSATPEHTASQYIKLFGKSEYSRIHWDTYQERWKKAISDNQEKLIHPVFNQEELERMRREWGPGYSDDDLYQLEDLYTNMKNSFGVSDPASQDNARKMCKISKEIDRCIASGGAGLDKLVGSYQKIQAIGGFTSEKAKDFNNFDSVSEIMQYLEKTGWVRKFHNDETRDIVDNTIKNIQAYNHRLYQSESTMTDQIDNLIASKRRMDALEDSIMEENLDQYEVSARDTDLLDEMEDFNPEVD